MMESPPVLRFAGFEFDLRAELLRRNGVAVHLQDKALRLLQVLLTRPGQLITRAELQQALWPDQKFGEFDDGLNTVVRKLREALDDDALQPRCIATVPRRGYRWIAPLEPRATDPPPPAAPVPSPRATRGATARHWLWAVAIAVSVLAAAAVWRNWRPVYPRRGRAEVLLLPLANHTGDASLDGTLDTALAVSLEQSSRLILFPSDRLPGQLRLLGQPPSVAMTPRLGRAICRREGVSTLIAPAITRTGQEYAITAEVMDPASGAVLASHIERVWGRDHILDALGALAADLRHDGGESLFAPGEGPPPLPAVTTPSLSALRDYATGQTQWRHGHFAAAVTLYRAALLADPQFAMAHAALATADCSYIYYDEAGCRTEYARALAQPARLSARESALIQAHRADDLGQVEAAIGSYQAYLRAYPEDWGMLNDYAHLLRTHGREAQAIPIFRRLLGVAPNDARTYVELATAEMSSGDYRASLAAYRQAFRLDPHWELAGDTNREYGFTLLRAGHPRRAAAAFSDLLRFPALRPTGLVSQARLDFWQGHLARAEAEVDAALRAPVPVSPLATGRRHLLLAQLALARGDRVGGLRQLRRSVAQFDQIGPRLIWGALAGMAFARAGDAASATRLLARIAPLAHRQNREEEGYLRLLRGEIACAQGHAAAALTIIGRPNPDDGSSVEALATEARAHAAQKARDFPRAVRWYRRVLLRPGGYLGWEPQPRQQAAYLALARGELALGDRAAARAAVAPLLTLLARADADFALRRRALALAVQLH